MPSSGLKLQYYAYNNYNEQCIEILHTSVEGDGPIGGVARIGNDPHYDTETHGWWVITR